MQGNEGLFIYVTSESRRVNPLYPVVCCHLYCNVCSCVSQGGGGGVWGGGFGGRAGGGLKGGGFVEKVVDPKRTYQKDKRVGQLGPSEQRAFFDVAKNAGKHT